MTNTRIAAGMAVALCLAVCIAVPAGATSDGSDRDGHFEQLLDRLEKQGYDVSDIHEAIRNGEQETARELMRSFMERHAGDLPPHPSGWVGEHHPPAAGTCTGTE